MKKKDESAALCHTILALDCCACSTRKQNTLLAAIEQCGLSDSENHNTEPLEALGILEPPAKAERNIRKKPDSTGGADAWPAKEAMPDR